MFQFSEVLTVPDIEGGQGAGEWTVVSQDLYSPSMRLMFNISSVALDYVFDF